MSKAIAFYEPGGPEVLQLIDADEPKTEAGEVRIRVRAAGVQPLDVAVVAGFLPPGIDPSFPRVPGNEFAGVIDEVGEEVAGFAAGDEVLGFGLLNSYAEVRTAPAEQITAKPSNMAWEVAGGFSAAAQTAHIALRSLDVKADDTVLIHGAAGSVGAIAVQLANLWGASVLGAAREAHHEYVRDLGAIPVAYGDGFVERVHRLAPGGVQASLDGVGGAALQATLEIVEERERIITLVEHDKAAELGGRVTANQRSAARLAELADLYAQGRLGMRIGEVFPLARAADAHRSYSAGNNQGKIVLSVAKTASGIS